MTILTFILAVLAGAATPMVQPWVTQQLSRLLPEEHIPDAAGRQVAAFGLNLLAVAIVLKVAGGGASPVALMLGGIVGAFQEQIRGAITDRMG